MQRNAIVSASLADARLAKANREELANLTASRFMMALRHRLGMSQLQFADATGVAPSTVRTQEGMRRRGRQIDLGAMRQVFSVLLELDEPGREAVARLLLEVL